MKRKLRDTRRVFWLDLLSDGTVCEPVVAPNAVRASDAYGEVHLFYDEETDTAFTVDNTVSKQRLVKTLDQYKPGEL